MFVPTWSVFVRSRRLALFLGKITALLELDDIGIAVADMTPGVTR